MDDRPSCPFCSFAVESTHEDDMYSLLQHLELSHPENGESPFIAVKEPREDGARGVRTDGESATSSGTPSEYEDEDEAYVDCPAQCGEAVTLAELSGHMELHRAEGMAFEDTRRSNSREVSPNIKSGRATSTEPSIPFERPSSASITPGLLAPDTQTSEKKHTHSPHRRRHKDQHGLKSWKEMWIASTGKKPRSRGPKSGHTGAQRLGRAELGPHAYEEQMPNWLYEQLERGAKITITNQINDRGEIIRVESVANETPGIVPVLAQLCEQDPLLSKVFLCHPGVKHVVKQAREGGFCGYRNIQMMVSYIQATRFPGHENFPGRTPSILHLQDLIEAAWDRGIHASGRIETGGIRGTRKYIGTPEAQALFCSLGIGCEANAFNQTSDHTYVHDAVIQAVLEYFSSSVIDRNQISHKVYQTFRPPIYFQHPGHSLTIVGLEVRKSGVMNLLVLDPMFKTSPGICRLIGNQFRASSPEKLLKAYRRGDAYLRKYDSFEILKLITPPLPIPLPWNGSR